MKKRILVMVLAVCVMLSCRFPASTTPSSGTTPADEAPQATQEPASSEVTVPTAIIDESLPQVDLERMFSFLEELTSVQAYSGYRTAGSTGEAEALELVNQKLADLPYLQSIGMETEDQTFSIYLTNEIRTSDLSIRTDGGMVEVPADGLRGSVDDILTALNFDSDGVLNDDDADPVTREGKALWLDSEEAIANLSQNAAEGAILFVDNNLLDENLSYSSGDNAQSLVDLNPAAIVIVTQYANTQDESHGTFTAEGGAFSYTWFTRPVPILYARVEDLGEAGIESMDDLNNLQEASLTWDSDVFSPATSGNLIARIPGKDSSRALILGAHIDSPNSPGAMDDGSGTAVLLEVARALNDASYQPPVDLYLAWFGSEENGLYGGAYFANTHQDLLDRAVGMVQFDCLSRPVDGITTYVQAAYYPGNQVDDGDSPWVAAMRSQAGNMGIDLHTQTMNLSSDNSSFDGYNVPNFDIILDSDDEMSDVGGVWFGGHLHDPYDRVELAREVSEQFKQMAQIALQAVALSGSGEEYRPVAPDGPRLVVVASHTEPSVMTPALMNEWSMAFNRAGFDVDLIPYGTTVNAADLEGADLVVVLPVVDYPGEFGDVNLYDESWSEAEAQILKDYVDAGGLLLLTNSAYRLEFYGWQAEGNEDWRDPDTIAQQFGVEFTTNAPDMEDGYLLEIRSENPLAAGIEELEITEGNAVAFRVENGNVLAGDSDEAYLAIVDSGSQGGQVIVMADLGIFASSWKGLNNDTFVENLIAYTQNR